jgi:hydrogenase expression/formation protein HypD
MSDLIRFIGIEYRRKDIIRLIAKKIEEIYNKIKEDSVKIMSFCGTHEHTITYYGIRSIIPSGIELVAGPGCPVCITPAKNIDEVVKLSLDGIKVYTYGDVYRTKGSKMSLQDARAEGGDVTIVYSFLDAIKMARRDKKESVFFAVGFETTVPTVAPYLAKEMVPDNLKLLLSYRLTPPAMRYVLSSPDIPLVGIIAPGHVSTIIGAKSWEFVASEYDTPVVVAGFEPLDVMIAIYEILKQLGEKPHLVNEYSRVVKWEGNLVAQRYINEVFEKGSGEWRGMGTLTESAYLFKRRFKKYDSREVYKVDIKESIDYLPGCRCAEITVGKAYPTDCPLFKKACTPTNPKGPCMVSVEGTCFIWAKYGGRVEELSNL